MFSYFTENYTDIPPDGMMCTNVSMWSAVYWTPENVSECACEIETKKEVEIKEVFIQSIPKQNMSNHSTAAFFDSITLVH